MGAAVPRRLRHGGASADATAEAGDATLIEQGLWGPLNAVFRYQRPGRDSRQLPFLSPQQCRLILDLPRLIQSKARELLSLVQAGYVQLTNSAPAMTV